MRFHQADYIDHSFVDASGDAEASSGSALEALFDRLAENSNRTVAAAGAWTPSLLPHLGGCLRATGQPICWFRPADPDRFRPPRFRVWTADVIEKGWYGFPALDDGRVKVANHGAGRVLDADRLEGPPSGPPVLVCLHWEGSGRLTLYHAVTGKVLSTGAAPGGAAAWA